MLQKSDGYFLIEQLLSFYAIILICTFLLPQLVELKSHSETLKMKKQALQLLYEQLNIIKIEDSSFIEKTWEKDGRLYRVYLDEPNREVCVSVPSGNSSQIIGCEKIE